MASKEVAVMSDSPDRGAPLMIRSLKALGFWLLFSLSVLTVYGVLVLL
jgi:hypothetical protein